MNAFRLFGLVAIVVAVSATPARAGHIPQSPIDIGNPPPKSAPRPNFTPRPGFPGYPEQLNVDVEAEIKKGKLKIHAYPPEGAAKLEYNNNEYSLLEFHFHARSEHTLNGAAYDMELHLVHGRPNPAKQNVSCAGGADIEAGNCDLVVVGRWMEVGDDESKVLKPFFDGLPKPSDLPQPIVDGLVKQYPMNNFELSALLPSDILHGPFKGSHYQYDGSLTTGQDPNHTGPPPQGDRWQDWAQSQQDVRWIMLKQPIQISAAQAGAFEALFPTGNAHWTWPPMAGHKLILYVPEPSAVWLLAVAGLLAGCRMRRPKYDTAFHRS